MPRRTLKELAAENAVLFGKLEEIRDDLEEFLTDDTETEADDGFPDDVSDELADEGSGEDDGDDEADE
jgi:hypothetical protein